jgi:hypothetical protein
MIRDRRVVITRRLDPSHHSIGNSAPASVLNFARAAATGGDELVDVGRHTVKRKRAAYYCPRRTGGRVAEGDGLPIRAQRLTRPNFPRTNSPSSSPSRAGRSAGRSPVGVGVLREQPPDGGAQAGDIRRNSPRLIPPMMFAGGAARPIIRTSLSICCYLVHAPRIT